MCLDLFGEEYGDVTFLPGPRRSGRDRGADAIYRGRLGRHGGTWKIACAIRQNARGLGVKIDEERDKAVKAKGFTGMVVMTSFDADAPTRIHGELLMLGIDVSERTVSRYLPRRRPVPGALERWIVFCAIIAARSLQWISSRSRL